MEKEQVRSGANTWKGGIMVKEHWSHANHANTWRVRPRPAPNHSGLSCLLTELHFQFLSCVKGLCSVRLCVWRCACQQLESEQDVCLSVYLSV